MQMVNFISLQLLLKRFFPMNPIVIHYLIDNVSQYFLGLYVLFGSLSWRQKSLPSKLGGSSQHRRKKIGNGDGQSLGRI
jgi:hypothetical protein